MRGLSTEELAVWAGIFYTRKQALNAASEANSRVLGKLGKISLGTRRWAQLLELPVDTR